jgi:hypothetical protein
MAKNVKVAVGIEGRDHTLLVMASTSLTVGEFIEVVQKKCRAPDLSHAWIGSSDRDFGSSWYSIWDKKSIILLTSSAGKPGQSWIDRLHASIPGPRVAMVIVPTYISGPGDSSNQLFPLERIGNDRTERQSLSRGKMLCSMQNTHPIAAATMTGNPARTDEADFALG